MYLEERFIQEKRSKSTRGKRRTLEKIKEKEKGFVLDCLNEKQSKLQNYNTISDKFLNYFVIRVHPNRKNIKKITNSTSQISKLEVKEKENHNRFQEMLLKEKAKLNQQNPTVTCTARLSDKEKPKVKVFDYPDNQRGLVKEIQESIKFK